MFGGMQPTLDATHPMFGGTQPMLGGMQPMFGQPMFGGMQHTFGGMPPMYGQPMFGGMQPTLGGMQPVFSAMQSNYGGMLNFNCMPTFNRTQTKFNHGKHKRNPLEQHENHEEITTLNNHTRKDVSFQEKEVREDNIQNIIDQDMTADEFLKLKNSSSSLVIKS